ncbi:phospho-N-acetylmuramoyl-pentapeptide-transferase [Candidatus Woesebacteria bacterium]|nr:phospho-N-acetylmuramoyl-pentapeptide-transferase [Candidatus Woesebacteria bacterium]MCD8507507.1 phospho-N-acetylmuramoyl-pentapeptide-transferase [Candidatus Woesebacteria bacterium]MCD8526691.1 phospho-N-acetylmuramoyl-pentapeptide-transferase [Candidatus Woesebacteria bacterium]MCD8545738.1 phospho-N-acetylmuramoyl-pentapeptide-transferase [Candidatus Woesebacteria bacterium]
MHLVLGLLIFSFCVTSAFIVPFIDMLYRLRFQRQKQKTTDAFGDRATIFDTYHAHKAGVPVGGGILIILVTSLIYALVYPAMRGLGITTTNVYPLIPELVILFFSFWSFGLIGLYDDIKKFFGFKESKFFGLRMRHKLMLQLGSALITGSMMYFWLGINFLHLPFLGQVYLGPAFIAYAAFVIVSFANAVNITDGLDGLAGGVLLFCLFGLWVLSSSILDTTLSIFIALIIGSLIAFLYFNIYPARIFMGDVGALALGAVLAVMGLLLGKTIALVIIGGIFVAEIASSLIQLTSKRFRHKKVFPAAPFHLLLQYIGWEEPKIVMRAWMTGIILTAIGVWLAMI